MDSHNYPFFGQKSGFIVQSPSKNVPYFFIQCVKQKQDGSWEKTSQGEGQKVKFSLNEMASMLHVLQNNVEKWNTYHTFKENKTPINFNWKDNALWVSIGEYKRRFNWDEIEIFKRLLDHILQEKIEYATTNITKINNSENISNSDYRGLTRVEEEITGAQNIVDNSNQTIKIKGKISATSAKALLITFPDNKEIWIPRSTIRDSFNENTKEEQIFEIDNWILERNEVSV